MIKWKLLLSLLLFESLFSTITTNENKDLVTSNCFRGCFHFKAVFLLFLSKESSADTLEKLKLMLMNEVGACSLLEFSFFASFWSPTMSESVRCCEQAECNSDIESLSWDAVTLSLRNLTNANGLLDVDDAYGMRETLLKILNNIPVVRRRADSVYLITDYAVNMMDDEYLDDLYPFIGVFQIIILGGRLAKYYPNPIIAEDALELVRTVDIPAMCAHHQLGVVTGGNVNDFHQRSPPPPPPEPPLLVTPTTDEDLDDLCPSLRNITLSPDLPLDFHLFVAFSENMVSSDIICVREMFHSLLTLAHMETNSGKITVHGPRAQTFVVCSWDDYQKCLRTTDGIATALLQVSTLAVNDADLDFAPDVLNLLRSEAIRAYEQKRTLIVIVSDFISLEFPLNSLFFRAALSRQNIDLSMAVVTEWNGLNRANLIDYYGNLTNNIYEIPSFKNMSLLLGIWSASMKTSTTLPITVPSTPGLQKSTTEEIEIKVDSTTNHHVYQTPPTKTTTMRGSINNLDPTMTTGSTNQPTIKSDHSHAALHVLYIFLASLCGLGLVFLVIYITYFLIRRNRFLTRENKMLTLQHSMRLSEDEEDLASISKPSSPETPLGVNWILSELEKDPWEMDRRRIIVGRQVGRGTSGIVYKGALIGKAPVELIHKKAFFAYQFDSRAVAIKMMPLHFEESKRHGFIEEIETLKRLPPHPNICGLLGCVTGYSPLCMVIEFASQGDLKKHLQSKRLVDCPGSACAVHTDSPCLKTLITYAWQIADGLKFIHSHGLLHRDLAARNILLNQSGNVQISDFGLAIWMDRATRNRTSKLPIKWTAIEALRYGEFSFYSDIWCFGVCLWELFSLGDEPYSHVDPDQFLSYLACGKRLKHPKNCPQQVWNTMKLCWSEHPRDRPSLESLRNDFGKILEDFTAGYGYLELQTNAFENITFEDEES